MFFSLERDSRFVTTVSGEFSGETVDGLDLFDQVLKSVQPELTRRVTQGTRGIRMGLDEQAIASGSYPRTRNRKNEFRLATATRFFSARELHGMGCVQDHRVSGFPHDRQ